MMAEIGLRVSYFWGSDESATGDECLGCGDPIYGTVYFPIFQIGEAHEGSFTDGKTIMLCPLCYDEIKEDDQFET